MKFDKNEYEGLVRRPLMMVKKSDENSRALALDETVGKDCFLARTTPRPVHFFFLISDHFIQKPCYIITLCSPGELLRGPCGLHNSFDQGKYQIG